MSTTTNTMSSILRDLYSDQYIIDVKQVQTGMKVFSKCKIGSLKKGTICTITRVDTHSLSITPSYPKTVQEALCDIKVIASQVDYTLKFAVITTPEPIVKKVSNTVFDLVYAQNPFLKLLTPPMFHKPILLGKKDA